MKLSTKVFHALVESGPTDHRTLSNLMGQGLDPSKVKEALWALRAQGNVIRSLIGSGTLTTVWKVKR